MTRVVIFLIYLTGRSLGTPLHQMLNEKESKYKTTIVSTLGSVSLGFKF